MNNKKQTKANESLNEKINEFVDGLTNSNGSNSINGVATTTGTDSCNYTLNGYSGQGEYGWICPKCGRVNAPWVSQCPCSLGGGGYNPPIYPWWQPYCEVPCNGLVKNDNNAATSTNSKLTVDPNTIVTVQSNGNEVKYSFEDQLSLTVGDDYEVVVDPTTCSQKLVKKEKREKKRTDER